MKILLTQAAFARKIGFTRQYINELVKKGIVELTDNKKIDYDKAIKAIEEHKDPRRDPQREAHQKRKEKNLFSMQGKYKSYADMTDEEKAAEYQKTQKELEKLNKEAELLGLPDDVEELDTIGIKELNRKILIQELRIKKAKADVDEKKSIQIEQIEKSVFNAVRIVRNGLLGLPARLAPKLAVTSDIHTCRTMLETEITAQLENLSKVFENE
ncbi:MAG: hypothetical protein LBF71_05490 [Campylobacteraceae bacterium]|nr:hypothetical protein [Campylobacteraceae bacterium]